MRRRVHPQPWGAPVGRRSCQCARKLRAHLGLLLGREDVDDAGQRLRRVIGVQRCEDKVARLGDGERELDRLEVTHLADEETSGSARRAERERRQRSGCPYRPRAGSPSPACVHRRTRSGPRWSGCGIGRSMLIWLMIEARVVDFPDPVGPVTRIRPWCLRVRSPMTGGRPSSDGEGIRCGITRSAIAVSRAG